MKLTRRGLFGLFGGAVATAALPKVEAATPTYQHTEYALGFTLTEDVFAIGDFVTRDPVSGVYRRAKPADLAVGYWDGSRVVDLEPREQRQHIDSFCFASKPRGNG